MRFAVQPRRAVKWRRVDLSVTADPWDPITLLRCRRRANFFHDMAGKYDLDANDSFTMALDFTNGALGVVHASRWATGHLNELRLRIYGDRGGIEVLER